MSEPAGTRPEVEKATILYMLVPPSPLFAAHWSLYLPDLDKTSLGSGRQTESTKGRRIHVSGDRLNGFALEIIRDYDVSKHRSVGSRRYPVASIRAVHLQQHPTVSASETQRELKDDDEGGGYVDNRPKDDLEQACVDVDAPGPSLNHVVDRPSSTAGRMPKAEVGAWHPRADTRRDGFGCEITG